MILKKGNWKKYPLSFIIKAVGKNIKRGKALKDGGENQVVLNYFHPWNFIYRWYAITCHKLQDTRQ